jgi:DNA (cytosine-5)-methyltransferase 1
LFIIARCDGEAIVWPEKNHGTPPLAPYRTAAECIDWSLPCPSIFDRVRPLAENTLRRIARGIQKFVIECKEPFIVTCNHGGGDRIRSAGKPLMTLTAARDAHGLVVPVITKIGQTGGNGCRISGLAEPLRTICSKNEDCLVAANLIHYHNEKGGECRGQNLNVPAATIDTSNRMGLVTAFLSKYFKCSNPCADLNEPMPTVTAIDHNALVTSHLTKFYGTNIGSDMREPVPTVTATGNHIGEVRAFLIKYYGQGAGQKINTPLHTVKSHDTFGLVTVAGEKYQIADIGLRMLAPRELARAQGFPDSYKLTGSGEVQVAKIGNSVCPPVACEIVKANVKVREIQKVKAG